MTQPYQSIGTSTYYAILLYTYIYICISTHHTNLKSCKHLKFIGNILSVQSWKKLLTCSVFGPLLWMMASEASLLGDISSYCRDSKQDAQRTQDVEDVAALSKIFVVIFTYLMIPLLPCHFVLHICNTDVFVSLRFAIFMSQESPWPEMVAQKNNSSYMFASYWLSRFTMDLNLPSGNLTYSYWKWSFIAGFP